MPGTDVLTPLTHHIANVQIGRLTRGKPPLPKQATLSSQPTNYWDTRPSTTTIPNQPQPKPRPRIHPMAGSNIATTQVAVPHGGAPNTSRFFSKLARSPTGRKHKPTPSVNSSESDTPIEQVPSIPTNLPQPHSRAPRPPLGRYTTTPNGQVTLVVPPDTAPTRSHSHGTKDPSTQGNGTMLDIGLSAAMLRPPAPATGNPKIPDRVQPMPLVYFPATIESNPFQQLQDVAAKRIATLEYMRRAHEGKKYWFNSIHFSKSDISKMPSYTPNRLSRRAMNYLLLGLSIPVVLDVHPQPHGSNTAAANAALALELLRSLNTLLTEFEAYQTLHPTDGSHVSSLSRARLPQMFKRATTTSRPRKSSGAPDIAQASQISPPAIPDGHQHMSHDSTYSMSTFASSTPTLVNGSPATPLSSGTYSISLPSPGPVDAPNSTLLPNEGPYTHLLTPSVPFLPDFYSVFATLCDVLTDVYQRLLQVVSSQNACTATVLDSFSKADAKMRKIMVGGIIRDFEGQAREAARKELLGVQKVVLGGLMGS